MSVSGFGSSTGGVGSTSGDDSIVFEPLVERTLFDDFTRSVGSGWGTSTSGLPWIDIPGSGELDDWSSEPLSGNNYVDGSRGILSYNDDQSSGADPVQIARFDTGIDYPIYLYYEAQGIGPASGLRIGPSFSQETQNDQKINQQVYFAPYFYYDINSWLVFASYYDTNGIWFYADTNNQAGYDWGWIGSLPSGSSVFIVASDAECDAVWSHLIYIDGAGFKAKKWIRNTTEPAWQLNVAWNGYVPPKTHFRNITFETQAYAIVNTPQPRIAFDNIALGPSYTQLTALGGVDDFDRSVGPAINGGWGTSSLGTWVFAGSGGVAVASGVDGDKAYTLAAGAGSDVRQYSTLDLANGSFYDVPYQILVTYTLPSPPTTGTAQICGIEVGWSHSNENIWGSISLVVEATRNSSGEIFLFGTRINVTDSNFDDIQTVSSATYSNSWLSVPLKTRVEITNTYVYSRTWLASGAEPVSWDTQVTFSGYTFTSLFPEGVVSGLGIKSAQVNATTVDSYEIIKL